MKERQIAEGSISYAPTVVSMLLTSAWLFIRNSRAATRMLILSLTIGSGKPLHEPVRGTIIMTQFGGIHDIPSVRLAMVPRHYTLLFCIAKNLENSGKSYNGQLLIRAARYSTTPYDRTRLILCLGCCQFGVLKVKASLGPAHSGVTRLDQL